ncbi:MAG TPA: hypothetical protein VHT03_04010 [Rhizomicrobium sp.]|nr:hypothetical protein [Rhizomicrobium sp.]
MRLNGWIRLWIVVTIIAVPTFSIVETNHQQAVWDDINKAIIKQCVDEEFDSPKHPDALECGRQQGTYKTFFERENTTPLRYWSVSLAFSFAADCILTGLLLAAFFAARWVFRGFYRKGAPETPSL